MKSCQSLIGHHVPSSSESCSNPILRSDSGASVSLFGSTTETRYAPSPWLLRNRAGFPSQGAISCHRPGHRMYNKPPLGSTGGHHLPLQEGRASMFTCVNGLWFSNQTNPPRCSGPWEVICGYRLSSCPGKEAPTLLACFVHGDHSVSG